MTLKALFINKNSVLQELLPLDHFKVLELLNFAFKFGDD
jgi:hypothetical protein